MIEEPDCTAAGPNEAGRPSIAETPPEEQGGRLSRNGYEYQDLCALRYSICAAAGGLWEQVWCESHDDIVLYAVREGQERYRFVQVKYRSEPAQHWTVARLCEHPRERTIGDSVICKLFAKDTFSGLSDFRLATNVDASVDLNPLIYRWGHVERTGDTLCAGAQGLATRLRDWSPANGKPVMDHIVRFAIERHSLDPTDMEVLVARELGQFLAERGRKLLADEVELVFRFLYGDVYRAAAADLDREGHPERIVGTVFEQRALSESDRVLSHTELSANTPPAEILRAQLTAANADSALIQNAVELRQRFFTAWRTSAGTEFGHLLDEVLADVQAICNREILRLRAEARHRSRSLLLAVLEAAEALHERRDLESRGIGLHLVHGMCYFTIGRGGLILEGVKDALD